MADKIKHKVFFKQSGRKSADNSLSTLIKKAVIMTLQSEAVDMPCVVCVFITGDDEIRAYNRDFRGIDEATDTLSFPMQLFSQAGWGGLCDAETDEDTGDIPLGDVIISKDTVRRHADEYGNSLEHETVYMIIHSTLHLLGYDHGSESEEKVMHNKSKAIMHEMGFCIND